MSPSPSHPAPTPSSSTSAGRTGGTSGARFLAVALVFLASYVLARWGIETRPQGSLAALAFALAPVLPFAVLMVYYVRNVRAMDELERRIQLEALAVAYPVALLVVLTAGLLDLAGFHGKHDWDLPRLWPLILLPYWFGLWRARVRYS